MATAVVVWMLKASRCLWITRARYEVMSEGDMILPFGLRRTKCPSTAGAPPAMRRPRMQSVTRPRQGGVGGRYA